MTETVWSFPRQALFYARRMNGGWQEKSLSGMPPNRLNSMIRHAMNDPLNDGKGWG